VRDAHRHTEPVLGAIDGESRHEVACLLDSGLRKKVWTELAAGRNPFEARINTLGDAPPPETVHASEGDIDLADALPGLGDPNEEPAVAGGDQTTEGEAR
jgi:hypothetical protein